MNPQHLVVAVVPEGQARREPLAFGPGPEAAVDLRWLTNRNDMINGI